MNKQNVSSLKSASTKEKNMSQTASDEIHSLASRLGGYKSVNVRCKDKIQSLASENASLKSRASINPQYYADAYQSSAQSYEQSISASASMASARAASVCQSADSSASIGAVANSLARQQYSARAVSASNSASKAMGSLKANFQRGRQIFVKQTQQAVDHQSKIDGSRTRATLSHLVNLAPDGVLAEILAMMILRAANDITMSERKKYVRGYQPVMDSQPYKILESRYDKIFNQRLHILKSRLVTEYLLNLDEDDLANWLQFVKRLLESQMYKDKFKKRR